MSCTSRALFLNALYAWSYAKEIHAYNNCDIKSLQLGTRRPIQSAWWWGTRGFRRRWRSSGAGATSPTPRRRPASSGRSCRLVCGRIKIIWDLELHYAWFISVYLFCLAQAEAERMKTLATKDYWKLITKKDYKAEHFILLTHGHLVTYKMRFFEIYSLNNYVLASLDSSHE